MLSLLPGRERLPAWPLLDRNVLRLRGYGNPGQSIQADPSKYYGALAAYITTYLAIKAPQSYAQTAQVMICPAAWKKIPPGQSYNPPSSVPVCYFSPDTIYADAPGTNTMLFHYPFGRPNGGVPPPVVKPDGSSPMAKLSTIPKPSDQWAMTDADKYNVPSGATYYPWLPDKLRAWHHRSGSAPISLFRLARKLEEDHAVARYLHSRVLGLFKSRMFASRARL